jgi:uncharacterized membrane protein
MTGKAQRIAEKFLRREWENLTEQERRVINSLIERKNLSHDTNTEFDGERTFGEKVADKVAAFGGSWKFIIIFSSVLVGWILLNSLVLLSNAFDPFPYILLNLFLSMTAALQAPIIMMSQNRQAARDRLDAGHDYEVNLKAELEIRTLQEKVDVMLAHDWKELIETQQKQIEMLKEIIESKKQEK